jgi:hypothetical protein
MARIGALPKSSRAPATRAARSRRPQKSCMAKTRRGPKFFPSKGTAP